MNKYTEIMQEIKNTTEAIKEAESLVRRIDDDCMKISDKIERYNERKKREDEELKILENILDLKITQKILQSNAIIASFNEVMPVALSIIAKYVGKPYGDKTRSKIADEVKEATGSRIYFSDEYKVYSNSYSSDFSCGTKYINGERKSLLIDNKIQAISFDEMG